MPNSEEFTNAELARGQQTIMETLGQMKEEASNQHHRLRNDLAPLLASTARNEERLKGQAKDITRIDKELEDVRADHKWLLRAIIGAYGAIALAVVGVLLGRV